MKNFLFLFFFTALLSCKKDSDSSNVPLFFWKPDIAVIKGDKAAVLTLRNPLAYTSYSAEPATPDYFEIYYSTDSSDLKFYRKADVSTTQLAFSNLSNNVPYYFSVKVFKGGQTSLSDTVMTVPSAAIAVTELYSDQTTAMQRVGFSADRSLISYVNNLSLYLKNTATGSTLKTWEYSGGAAWAHHSNTIAYIAYKTENNTLYPQSIKRYNAETGTEDKITEIDYANYYISDPVFSPDDEALFYLSSEGNAEKLSYDIWKLDLLTKTKSRLSDFRGAKLFIDGMSMSGDGKSVYLSASNNLNNLFTKKRLFKYEFQTKTLLPLLKSAWDETQPLPSPDGKHIAFVSDRTGREELWLLNTETFALRQLTDPSVYYFDSRYANFRWIDNTGLAMGMYVNSKLKIYKVEI